MHAPPPMLPLTFGSPPQGEVGKPGSPGPPGEMGPKVSAGLGLGEGGGLWYREFTEHGSVSCRVQMAYQGPGGSQGSP